MLNPVFSPTQIKLLIPSFWEKGLHLTNIIDEEVGKTGNSAGIDIHHFTKLTTLDIIVTTIFGYEFDSLSNPDHELVKAYERLFLTKERSISFVERVFSMIPFLVNAKLFEKLPYLGKTEIQNAKAKIRAFCIDQIRQRNSIKQADYPKSGEHSPSGLNVWVWVQADKLDVLTWMIQAGVRDENALNDHLMTMLASG